MITQRFTDGTDAAAELLRRGELVAVPTETVYGLAADGTNEAAVRALYEVKGRPEVKPLSLMVAGPEAMEALCPAVPRAARVLAERFWPGPLTIVLPARKSVLSIVRAGGATVGLRCPDEEHTLRLLRRCAFPLAVPSANPSGCPSPKSAAEVLAYFDGKIAGVIDGGPCGIGRESTVASVSEEGLRILRPGALSEQTLRRTLTQSLVLVGITGGSGVGKSTLRRVLERRGALVIDADAVYHELCRSDSAMLSRLAERFPGAVVDGVLQRGVLGERVFSNPAELAALQAITDPCVDAEIDRRLSDFAAAGGRLAAVDAVNLVGTALEPRLQALLGVTAPEEIRCERIMQRDGISRDYALSRIRAQKPDGFYDEHCSHRLHNDGTLERFESECETILDDIERTTPWTN